LLVLLPEVVLNLFSCTYKRQWEIITGMTSFPIPSAGIRPILKDCLPTVEKDLIGSLNIIVEEIRKACFWAEHAAEHVKRVYIMTYLSNAH
jgi:hypothetical protein